MEILIEERSDYLFVKATGSWTEAEIPWQLEIIKDRAESSSYTKLFLDSRTLDLPKYEMTKLSTGKNIAQFFPAPFKIAILDLPEKINLFVENVAVNRGANLSVFSNQATALKWLLEPDNE